MIEVMAQVERDVKAGRYQNALRQRKVLAEGFRNVKQYLEGEFEVRKDTTSNLPADIQKGFRRHARPFARRLGRIEPAILRPLVARRAEDASQDGI